jgi:predicted Ser/Thr protein kinase
MFFLFVRIDASPTLQAFDQKNNDAQPMKEFTVNMRIQNRGKYFIGVYASSCNRPSCNESSSEYSTYTSNYEITASSNNSVPFWPAILIGGMAFLIVIAIFAVIIYCIVKKRKHEPLVNATDTEADDESEMHATLMGLCVKINEFPSGAITVEDQIGTGAFGEVFRGKWQGSYVALKRLKSTTDLTALSSELHVLSNLNHVHIVRLLGLYTSDKVQSYIVTEYVGKGSLHVLLQKDRLPVLYLLQMAKQIASGMVYLMQNHIIHRDLALRNILVEYKDDCYCIKISDFGLSRELKERYYYSKKTSFPVKWSAPEVLQFRKYTSRSDVWSYGIVLWELLEYAKEPYGDMSNSEAHDAVLHGYRLSKPDNCSEALYALMLWCWKKNEQDRPPFDEVFQMIVKILEEYQPGQTSPRASLDQRVMSYSEEHYDWDKQQTAKLFNKLLDNSKWDKMQVA